MKTLKIIILIAISFGIAGWIYNRHINTPEKVDSWLRIPSMEIMKKSYESTLHDNIQFCSVVPRKQKEAIFLLRDKSLIHITKGDVKTYCNEDVISSGNKEKEPFLVRALLIVNDAANDYVITQTANALWIDNPALPKRRKGRIKMSKQALVVFLPERPSEVYVTTGLMAEWN